MLESKRVLIVEDDDLIGMVLTMILEEERTAVVGPLWSRAEALHCAHTATLDAALLDVNLTDGTSYEVARVLQGRGVPFAFLSASEPLDVPKTLAPSAFLGKPVRMNEIVHALTRMVAR